MKKLLFIENDILQDGEVSVVKRRLSYTKLLDNDYIQTMETLDKIHFMDPKELGKVLFDPNNVICTYSMYTPNHFGSLYKLIDYLESASDLGITGRVYIDGSGCLCEYLGDYMEDLTPKERKAVKNAIKTNFIMSIDAEAKSFDLFRVTNPNGNKLVLTEMDPEEMKTLFK